MIGQPVSATVWHCHYSFRRPATETQQRFVTGDVTVLTADPTAADLLDVVRMVVARADKGTMLDFRLEHMQRVRDVVGLAAIDAPDRGWPAGLDVGAVVLEAGSRQLAAIGDLSKALALARAEIAALKAQLAAQELLPTGIP